MSKPISLKKFVAQIDGLSLELFAPGPRNCHLDFFRKLGERLGHSDSLHSIISPVSSQFLRGKFGCLRFGLGIFKLLAGLLSSFVSESCAESPHVKSQWLFFSGPFTRFHWLPQVHAALWAAFHLFGRLGKFIQGVSIGLW